MPAHYSHFIFAYEVLSEVFDDFPPSREATSYLAAGSQGPDIFYHNLRTRPSGIALGSLLHRRGYGSFCAQLLAEALETGAEPADPLFLYCLGFISHGILDRHLHPFINYFSGWYEPAEPSSERYRFAHAFYERIIDSEAVSRPGYSGLQDQFGLGIPGSTGANFGKFFDLSSALPQDLESILHSALTAVYPKTQKDPLLRQRLRNAYGDSRGFYLYCDQDEQERARSFARDQLSERGSIRWTALLHPPCLPEEDFLNLQRQSWHDPCGLGEELGDSVWDLWDRAAAEFAEIAGKVIDLVRGKSPGPEFSGLAPLIGDSDLRNTYEDVHLCSLELSRPRDLRSVIEVLDSGSIPPNWRRLVP